MGITTYKMMFFVSHLRQTDGRTDDGKFNSPPSSLLEAGDNKGLCHIIIAVVRTNRSNGPVKKLLTREEEELHGMDGKPNNTLAKPYMQSKPMCFLCIYGFDRLQLRIIT